MLRTAQALADAKVPQRRITRSMRELRRHLPDAMPLSGLAHRRRGDRVVVREGGSRWQAESGQYLLEFDGDPARRLAQRDRARRRTPRRRRRAGRGSSAASALEARDVDAALQAYERAIDADPAFVDAYVNLGRLLHDAGHLAKAERVYREAIKALRQRSGPAVQPRRAARRHGSRRRSGAKRTRRRCAPIRRSPTAITTSRCSAKGSGGRRMPSGTWRGIALLTGRRDKVRLRPEATHTCPCSSMPTARTSEGLCRGSGALSAGSGTGSGKFRSPAWVWRRIGVDAGIRRRCLGLPQGRGTPPARRPAARSISPARFLHWGASPKRSAPTGSPQAHPTRQHTRWPFAAWPALPRETRRSTMRQS